MEDEKKHLGKTIFELIGKNGAPWSVGTSALVAGLGVRLIHLSLVHSGEEGFDEELQDFFYLCDKDDLLFENYLHKENSSLNEVPLNILKMTTSIFKKILKRDYHINKSLNVDFNIGLQYLLHAAKQILNIIEVNQYQGTEKEEIKFFEENLIHAEVLYELKNFKGFDYNLE